MTTKKVNKLKKILTVVMKHWRSTIGSLLVLVSVLLLIFKKIEVETLAAIIGALIAAGYIPKPKNEDNEEQT
jgi:dolichyl-phosphate-mannose--protein O-mannosyl transferase